MSRTLQKIGCEDRMRFYDMLPRGVRDVLKYYPIGERETTWLYMNMGKMTESELLRATKTMAEKVVIERRARYISSGIY